MMNLIKEDYYKESKTWEISIDKSRWLFGIEWYKEKGWAEVSLAVVRVTIWWKDKRV